MFGGGYMVLSQIKDGHVIALALTFVGALAKLIIRSRWDRLCREMAQADSQAGR